MTNQNYLSRKPGLLRDYDRSMKRVHHLLVARYGNEEARSMIKDARQKFEELIPQIPFLGTSNILMELFFFPSSKYLAIYQAFKEHGRTPEQTGQVIYEIGEANLKAIPGWLRRVIAILWFSRLAANRMRRRAALNRKSPYPGDYRIDYVEGTGKGFDFGIYYSSCVVYDFFKQHNAAEIVPYICAIDKPASELCGWGLRRTTTLAGGYERCDFQFTRKGKTQVTIPPSLQEVH